MLGPSATMKPAPKPAINGSPSSILVVKFLAGREMALEPELLKLVLPPLLRLRPLGGQYASWAVAAGAAGTLLHELVLLVLLRHPKRGRCPCSLQGRSVRASSCDRRAIRSLPSQVAR